MENSKTSFCHCNVENLSTWSTNFPLTFDSRGQTDTDEALNYIQVSKSKFLLDVHTHRLTISKFNVDKQNPISNKKFTKIRKNIVSKN